MTKKKDAAKKAAPREGEEELVGFETFTNQGNDPKYEFEHAEDPEQELRDELIEAGQAQAIDQNKSRPAREVDDTPAPEGETTNNAFGLINEQPEHGEEGERDHKKHK